MTDCGIAAEVLNWIYPKMEKFDDLLSCLPLSDYERKQGFGKIVDWNWDSRSRNESFSELYRGDIERVANPRKDLSIRDISGNGGFHSSDRGGRVSDEFSIFLFLLFLTEIPKATLGTQLTAKFSLPQHVSIFAFRLTSLSPRLCLPVLPRVKESVSSSLNVRDRRYENIADMWHAIHIRLAPRGAPA
jgi:hypothetical protein